MENDNSNKDCSDSLAENKEYMIKTVVKKMREDNKNLRIIYYFAIRISQYINVNEHK